MTTQNYYNCEIRSLFKKIPQVFGGWKIDIHYKENEGDLFGKEISIRIDQNTFDKKILDLKKKGETLYFTDGMKDIDIFKAKNKYCISYSPIDTLYINFYFKKKEFEQLFNWIELEKN